MLVVEVFDETVRMVVLLLVEWIEGTEVRPATIVLVSHVIRNSTKIEVKKSNYHSSIISYFETLNLCINNYLL